MGSVIVVQFITIDGVIEDPDGSDGTPYGGWCYQFGMETIAGDKFRLGDALDTGVLLFGRRTWTLFSQRWPARTDEFSARMNAASKRVVAHGPVDVSAWPGSARLDGDLLEGVRRVRAARDVIVIGSTSVVRALVSAGHVDEYRLLVFPLAVGAGQRLFTEPAAGLRLASAERRGPTALLCYTQDRRDDVSSPAAPTSTAATAATSAG